MEAKVKRKKPIYFRFIIPTLSGWNHEWFLATEQKLTQSIKKWFLMFHVIDYVTWIF